MAIEKMQKEILAQIARQQKESQELASFKAEIKRKTAVISEQKT